MSSLWGMISVAIFAFAALSRLSCYWPVLACLFWCVSYPVLNVYRRAQMACYLGSCCLANCLGWVVWAATRRCWWINAVCACGRTWTSTWDPWSSPSSSWLATAGRCRFASNRSLRRARPSSYACDRRQSQSCRQCSMRISPSPSFHCTWHLVEKDRSEAFASDVVYFLSFSWPFL